MASVHHEMSMNRSWMTRPKSDFGSTVVIGVSQCHPTQPQDVARTAAASNRETVDRRRVRRRRMGSLRVRSGSSGRSTLA